MFPKLTSPCPAKISSLPSGEKNFCTLCSRKVHNLNLLTEEQRVDFLKSCSGDVCVAYTVQRKRSQLGAKTGLVLAAALLGCKSVAEQNDLQAAHDLKVTETYHEEFVGTVATDDIAWHAQDDESLGSVLPELQSDAPELEFIAEPNKR
jgi:hypothetical protein